jgi:transcriptional regulator GlxA family with amidase domain
MAPAAATPHPAGHWDTRCPPARKSALLSRETQSTPAEFVERARLDTARRMLEDTKQPIKRIAGAAGFGDANRLRRAFLRQLGVTPADYRRRF